VVLQVEIKSPVDKRLAATQLPAPTCDAHVQRPGTPNRATIKPSVRAAVLARDRHRCATPGCRSTHFLEVHHVTPRNEGGSNRAENLVTLCSQCRGFVHENGESLAMAPAVAPAQIQAR
jgi:5-methylcytosine-specific restriction endonuclease McrA